MQETSQPPEGITMTEDYEVPLKKIVGEADEHGRSTNL